MGSDSYQKGIINRYFEHKDTIMLTRLSELVSELYLSEGEVKVRKAWESAAGALTHLGVDPATVRKVCEPRDLKALAQLVDDLNRGVKPPTPGSAPSAPVAPAAPADPLAPETLKSALKAFRKRMKVTRLDDESQIGSSRNPLTSGARSSIVAIQPPNQFPRAVWDELVKQGKLKSAGRGFYQLVEGQ